MGFDELCSIYLGPIAAKFGHLGPCYLEASALLLAAKLRDLEGKLKLSWAMLCHVMLKLCQILFDHVVGFAFRNALPPAGPRF